MLLDLSENESSWNPDNILLDNVAKWSQSDKLYSVAAKFELFGIVGDGEILAKNIQDLKNNRQKLYTISQNALKNAKTNENVWFF